MIYGTTTSDGQFIGFVAADHYEKLAERRKAAKAERQHLEQENRRREAAGLPRLRGQLSLLDDEPKQPQQKTLF
jgi:hypothetical protein